MIAVAVVLVAPVELVADAVVLLVAAMAAAMFAAMFAAIKQNFENIQALERMKYD